MLSPSISRLCTPSRLPCRANPIAVLPPKTVRLLSAGPLDPLHVDPICASSASTRTRASICRPNSSIYILNAPSDFGFWTFHLSLNFLTTILLTSSCSYSLPQSFTFIPSFSIHSFRRVDSCHSFSSTCLLPTIKPLRLLSPTPRLLLSPGSAAGEHPPLVLPRIASLAASVAPSVTGDGHTVPNASIWVKTALDTAPP